MELDDVLEELGQSGRYQLLSYLLMGFPAVFLGAVGTSFVFTAAELDYRCAVPECEKVDEASWLRLAIPQGGRAADCLRYAANFSGVANASSCPAALFTNRTERCTQWAFPIDETSIQSEWNITCEENVWKLGMVGTVNNIAFLLGLPVFGYIADRFGRKMGFLFGMALTSILGFARIFSDSYITFLILEFLSTFVQGGNFSSIFILGMELMGPKKRAAAGIIINAFESFGPTVLGLGAWWLKDWKKIIIFLYAPSLIFIAYYWLLEESVRWLISQGRMQEAGDIIKKTAKANNVVLSPNAIKKFDVPISAEQSPEATTGDESPSLLKALGQVFQSRILLPRLLNCSYCWITNTFVYTGLSLNSVTLAGNKYMNYVLASLVEQPACILTYFMMDSMGRKATLCITMVSSGIACLACLIVPHEMTWLMTTFFMIGKFAITISFCTLYSFSAEIFPTNLRNSLLGACSMIGRLGSLAATQTGTLALYMESLPLILYGSMSFTSGLLALLFPETKNTKMPDTIEEAENFGKKHPAQSKSTVNNKEGNNIYQNCSSSKNIVSTDNVKLEESLKEINSSPKNSSVEPLCEHEMVEHPTEKK